MDRRGFLQCLGVFAACAMVPAVGQRIIRAPAWWNGPVTVYRSSVPLEAGNYTFTALAGDLGMYFGGVTATGGEYLFEIPGERPMTDARLKLGGIYFYGDGASEVNLTAAELLKLHRGPNVTKR